MTCAHAARPVVGLIVPPEADTVPPEAAILFPDGVVFAARGLGIAEMSPTGFDAGLERIDAAARALLDRGAEAISIMGTSLTFYDGAAGNERALDRLRRACPGIPVTTMSTSIVASLRELDARRVSVVGAYTSDMGRRLDRLLMQSGFEVASRVDLGVNAIADLGRVTDADLRAAAERALDRAGDAAPDALLISCGGLRTIDAGARIADELGLPVVSSAVDGIRHAVRLLE
ncbi:aspartate racemase/maleate isomerase family protein [Leucobacter sp. GX0328]